MRIVKVKDYEELSERAAMLIAAQIQIKPDCVLGLATGSTPIGTYEKLIRMYREQKADFAEVTSVNLDEYVGLDENSDQSYRYFMNQHLFDHVNIEKTRTHVPNGRAEDLEQECRRYDALIDGLGGIDLQLLGIGNNGHIGFNEPAGAFATGTHVVELGVSTIEANSRFFISRDQVPKKAVTMGIADILQAKKILLIASGKEKAQIVQQATEGPVTPQVPASILQLHKDCTILYCADH